MANGGLPVVGPRVSPGHRVPRVGSLAWADAGRGCAGLWASGRRAMYHEDLRLIINRRELSYPILRLVGLMAMSALVGGGSVLIWLRETGKVSIVAEGEPKTSR